MSGQDPVAADRQAELGRAQAARTRQHHREAQHREGVPLVALDPRRLAALDEVVERQAREAQLLAEPGDLVGGRALDDEPGERAVLERADPGGGYSQLMIQTQAPASAIVATIIAKSCDGCRPTSREV